MKKFYSFVVAILFSITTFAQFSGSGSGTSSDPYLIYNAMQLDQMRNFLGQSNVYFKLMADIDLQEFIAENYPTQGWLPIGTGSSSFLGNFDGNGKKIMNLVINRPSSSVGLFGYVAGSATISNCTIEESIIGGANTGGIVGTCGGSNCLLDNIFVKGTIEGSSCVGGLVGRQVASSITNCVADVIINGTTDVGGLVGFGQTVNVSSSSAFVTIQATGNYCGGIVGYNSTNLFTIEGCYVYGNLKTNQDYIGGITSYINGSKYDIPSVSNCYFWGNIEGSNYVGGICGYCYYGFIKQTYAKASISGNSYVGGILGYRKQSLQIEQNVAINSTVIGSVDVGRIIGYEPNASSTSMIGTSTVNKALTTTKVYLNNVEVECLDNEQHGQGVGKTVLKYKATYEGIEWDFANIWTIKEGESFPYFSRQVAPPTINEVTSGQTTVSGQGTSGKTIRVIIGENTYQTKCSGNIWSVTTSPLVAGNKITVIAGSGRETSYPATAEVAQASTVTISISATNGQVQGGGIFSVGSSVTLTAIPNEGYVFSRWSDGNTDNPRTITATEDATYTAIFISEDIPTNHFVFVSHQNGSTIGLASLSSHQTLEYSTDGVTWNNMTTAITITLDNGAILYMRGVLSDNNTSTDFTQFSMSGSITASGNINYLWNYQNLDEPLKAYCGMSLFKDCSALVSASELPATILAERCYQYMFQNCTALVSAPELPATTLVQSCYAGMFQDCASLTSAPQLPAETLSSHCYWRMFRGCTSLTTVPELPATIIAPYCYNQMFMQTAIATAPELPASTLEDYSYYQMFYQCSKLNKITCLAKNINATGCTTGWVTGVASSGTFIQNSEMTAWTTGKDGVPSGWTTQSRVVLTKYQVTFVDWDGTILKSEQVEEGHSATAPTSPIRDGYTFIGWDKSFSNVTSDLTITAQYSLGKDSDFTVIFYNGNDGSEILTHPVVLKVPAAPEIDGFTFLKWAVVDGDLEDIIEIQAIYTANMPTSAPSVYTNPSNPTQKLIRNGNVYILTGDKTYTVTGKEAR